MGSVPSALCMGNVEQMCEWCQGKQCHGGGSRVWLAECPSLKTNGGSWEGKGVAREEVMGVPNEGVRLRRAAIIMVVVLMLIEGL